jgi:hypothetical protein
MPDCTDVILFWLNLMRKYYDMTRIVEPEETAVAREWPINMFLWQWTRVTTIESCWKRCFLLGLPWGYIRRTNWSLQSVANLRTFGAMRSCEGVARQRGLEPLKNESRRHCWDMLPGNDWWRHKRYSECCSEKYRAWISGTAVITCSYDLSVFDESSCQSKLNV